MRGLSSRITVWLYADTGARQNRGPMFSRRLLSPAPDSGHAPEKFEELLARLEQIVSDMENAELPLEKLLESYEEGMRLVKACGDRLTDAEQKVEILSKAAPVKPAEVEPLVSGPEAPVAKEDEIRLF
jgi:exodeoxyribonuclease VII small subunit